MALICFKTLSYIHTSTGPYFFHSIYYKHDNLQFFITLCLHNLRFTCSNKISPIEYINILKSIRTLDKCYDKLKAI